MDLEGPKVRVAMTVVATRRRSPKQARFCVQGRMAGRAFQRGMRIIQGQGCLRVQNCTEEVRVEVRRCVAIHTCSQAIAELPAMGVGMAGNAILLLPAGKALSKTRRAVPMTLIAAHLCMRLIESKPGCGMQLGRNQDCLFVEARVIRQMASAAGFRLGEAAPASDFGRILRGMRRLMAIDTTALCGPLPMRAPLIL